MRSLRAATAREQFLQANDNRSLAVAARQSGCGTQVSPVAAPRYRDPRTPSGRPMITTTTEVIPFAPWIARIRAGDADAAAELVKRFERPVRVAVRARLTDVRLRRQFDSMDVVQSVLGSFFTRMTDGQFDLENPQQLVGLLMKMAQNKLLMQVRRHKQKRRDVTRTETGSDNAPPIPDRDPGPERQAIGRELLQLLYDRLTDDERDLAIRRAGGQQWTEIAAELGGTPQGHRMKLRRAVARVSPGLGFDDDTDPDATA